MIKPLALNLQTARALIDFSGGNSTTEVESEEQLKGSLALHNLLTQNSFAYLADEVGMGKTYVALGTVALFRHFHPEWRVLYITPRENIQQKWLKELQNFTANNWRVTDNRVRSFQGTPAYGVTLCHNLLDFARAAALNPNRDFILRLTSFSFGLGADTAQWKKKRDELLEILPWLDRSYFSLRDKDEFKTNFACALNAVVPHFDLVIVDECHNLKHGFQASGGASRNRLLGYLLGGQIASRQFPHHIRRFDRVLALSATPLESDYKELWNQQNIFGFGEPVLIEKDVEDIAKKEVVRQFLVRRLTQLTVNGRAHTKNMYRREWRNGGMSVHDEPLEMADDQQKLIVALVQKKVAEILGDERFKHSFQIGMLASFESFLETAKVRTREDDEGTFDDSDQTERDVEREGIDTTSVNQLARSYQQRFGKSLPHPKMDAVAENLKSSFLTGRKSLIFVRRVKSVSELTEKLNRHFDKWLRTHLLNGLDPKLHEEFERVFAEYESERRTGESTQSSSKLVMATAGTETGEFKAELTQDEDDLDEGANDNFFAWFFRGEGPKRILSGAAFKKNRLTSEGSSYSTLFENNYVMAILGESDNPITAIAALCLRAEGEVRQQLRVDAYSLYVRDTKQKTFRRRRVFRAFQEAALWFLAEYSQDADVKDRARIIARECFGVEPVNQRIPSKDFYQPDDWLRETTFFTELAERPALCAALDPEETAGDFTRQFRRREQRHELLGAAARLGRPLIDLWMLAVNGIGSLSLRKTEGNEYPMKFLLRDYLDLLEEQSNHPDEHTGFYELQQIVQHFDLILSVNFPTVAQDSLRQLPRLFGSALARQTPVGGMSGGVNKTLVQQFRMPGYPMVLVTTDVLQEGEDLHTFCSQVIHYGIAWTPSALEQRTGRVDRIRSLTSRRLQKARTVTNNDWLQVYYPHLLETVERLQVERVYERMNRFIRLMHKDLISDLSKDSYVNTKPDMLRQPWERDIAPITELLKTPFDVQEEWLGNNLTLSSTDAVEESTKALQHFQHVTRFLCTRWELQEEPSQDPWSFFVTIYLDQEGYPVLRGHSIAKARYQPLTMFLRTAGDYNSNILLRCVSPIGQIAWDDQEETERIHQVQQRIGIGRICALLDAKNRSYDLTIETDMLFHPNTTQAEEVAGLVERTSRCADLIEKMLLNVDQPMDKFRADLFEEPKRG